MNHGDIYMVLLDPTEGREPRGHRPVMIASTSAFNEATKLPVVLPITNGAAFAQRIGCAVPISGIKTTGVVRCNRSRVLDIDARLGRKVDVLPTAVLEVIMTRLATIFK